jgi:aldose 1-epimerase
MGRMAVASPTGQQFTIRHDGAEATVVEVGGGLRTHRVDGREVLDGYLVDAMASSGRGQLLIPWPNRLDHGRYVWDGVECEAPINEPARSNAIHGLVRSLDWSGTVLDDARVDMRLTLRPSPAYPFTLSLLVSYELDANGLSVTTTATNDGDAALPYGMGQHPYVMPASGVTVDDCGLTIPAETYLETDERGLPVSDHPVAGSQFDFTTARPIGPLVLDTAFTRLQRDADGLAEVELAGPSDTITVWMDDAHPYVQVFTADTLPEPERRRSVAIEPMTCSPNAFATGADVIRLEPGEAVTTRWGISVSR